MTATLTPPRTGRPAAAHRPLTLLASLAGVAAAGGMLAVCLAAGVIGWFVTDGGVHGEPRDGLRAGPAQFRVEHAR